MSNMLDTELMPSVAPISATPIAGPAFSIVTVVLNDMAGFLATRESIAALRGPGFEWVVIDGGSTDGLVEYLEDGDPLVTVWRSRSDSGIYDAMNEGAALACGEFVVFMNAGDYFPDPNALAHVQETIDRGAEQPDVVFGGAELVFENGLHYYRAPRRAEYSIWHGLPANHQATYYKRELLLKVPYDLSFRICGDYYLVASLMRRGVRTAYVKRALVAFRIGDTSHQNKRRLLLEPYRIQRDILHSGWVLCAVSFARRAIVTAIVTVIGTFPKLRGREGAT